MHKKKVILIRHGEAASTWDGDDRDPGLSKKGVEQAKSINDFTKSIFSKRYDFISSPKKRAIETLNYASEDIDVNFDINEGFVEIPAEDIDSNIRFEWLKEISTRKIETLPDDIKNWRERIITETINLKNNSIIFCHFMVINVLVGYAIKKDRLLHFYPDNASITEIEVENKKISVISMKDVEKTIINVWSGIDHFLINCKLQDQSLIFLHLKENKKVLVSKNKSLNEDVKKALKLYFKSLDSQEPRDVYDLVMREVETPLFNFILQHTNNNQSKAAKILGINRGTFRTKLKKYGIIK